MKNLNSRTLTVLLCAIGFDDMRPSRPQNDKRNELGYELLPAIEKSPLTDKLPAPVTIDQH